METAKFHRMCPNCFGVISDERLKKGLPCERCLPVEVNFTQKREICNLLGDKLKGFKELCDLEEFTREFVNFFKEKTGFTPWNLQVTWAKRVALKKSFTLIAPTGVGKTTWGIVTAAFLKGKSYIIVPSKLLVEQTVERLKQLTEKTVVAYTGKKKEKELIKNGEFEILVTTTNFLYRNYEIIPKPFSFVFVDDVDSLLKSARNVDKVIGLLGFKEKDFETALKVIELKSLAAKLGSRADKKLLEKIRYLEGILERKREKIENVLVISSATSQPKSKRIKLFRELLGFEVGKSATTLRNVEDVLLYPEKELLTKAKETIKKFGKGVFVFVASDFGKEFVETVVEEFKESGIEAVSYEEFNLENQQKFIEGKIEAVVGISSYRNPLARGIDLPQAVRYAVFIGVPKMEFAIKLSLSPVKLFGLLLALRELFPERESGKVLGYVNYLKNYLSLKEEMVEKYPRIKEKLEEVKSFLESFLNDENFLEKIKTSETVSLKEKEGELFIVVGDAAGYVQASGRTSRMFAGGLTKGVAITIVDDLKALNSLKKRLSVFLEDVNFKVLDEEKGKVLSERFGFPLITEKELEEIFKKVDEDRERVKEILEGKISPKTKSLVSTALVIVESPNKARTIANFFGKPVRRKIKGLDVYEINTGKKVFLLTASKGHVFDLTVRDGLWGIKEEMGRFIPYYDTIKFCTKCSEQTTEPFCPKCKQKPDVDKIEIIRALREVSLEVDEILVASDPDTEGEKIGWDVGTVLMPYQNRLKRMEFHEVTKWAFAEALENPRDVNENLVKAQIVRRVADRWIGFSLSQHLWEVFKMRWLSAGRVQTPVLGWVIERSEESKEKVNLLTVTTEFGKFSFKTEKPVKLKKEGEWEVVIKVEEERTVEKNPLPPFNTGELLREASNLLNFSAEKTMELAQDLFESGFITYHRTDSTRVSTAGMGVAREYISEKFGPELVKLRPWGEGGAHECIRPTRPLDKRELETLITVSGSTSKVTKEHLKLYDLIFRRFIASQMVPVKVIEVKTSVTLEPLKLKEGETFLKKIIKSGWNLIVPLKERKLEIEGSFISLPVLDLKVRKVPKVFPYTQGELVEEMRRRKIGRPSTYAKIVQTLLERNYVIERGRFLYPTKLGIKVYNYLSQKFPLYTSEEFTRKLEELMDLVEEGKVDYQEIIKNLREAEKTIEKAK